MKLGWVLSVILLLWISPAKAQSSASHFTIIFTANLNAALDDCGCSDSTVGGVNRVKTVIDSLRTQYPGAFLVDGGDFLSSYPDSHLNATMREIISGFQYDVVAMGDQELVEGIPFFQQLIQRIPIFAHNVETAPSPEFIKIKRRVPISSPAFWAVTDPEAFDFIDPGGVKLQPISQALQKAKESITVLIFHGTVEKAMQIALRFPQIPLILVGHDQRKVIRKVGHTTIVSVGSEGEFVAFIHVKKFRSQSQIAATFIPVTRGIIPDPQIQKVIQQFYDALQY